MQCPSCGSPVVPGGAFCEKCGADVRTVTQPAPMPSPPQQPYAPQPYAPQPYAPQPYAQQPTQPYPPQPPSVPPGYQQPAYGQQSYPPAAPAKRSSGAVVGIVIAVLFVLAALGVGGYFFATGAFSAKKPPSGVSAPATVTAAVPVAPAPGVEAPPADDGVVTDAEARAVVTDFMEARLAMDVAASKQFCSPAFLDGEMKPLIDDKYWRPDSYEITMLTPDLMYIHVTVMGEWPSGREATIYSVWRDPNSGKVLIDGFLEPEFFPELVTP